MDLAAFPCVLVEAGAQSIGEFLGSLVGEGDAECGLRCHAFGHHTRQPIGHGGRLARPGAGRDPEWFHGMCNHRLLLGGADVLAHTKPSRPSGQAGHNGRTAHLSHWLPG